MWAKFFRLVLVVSIFISGSSAFSQTQDDSARWSALVEKMAQTGKLVHTFAGTYVMMKEITPKDQSLDHVANYISLVGRFASPTEFALDRVEAVWEKWTTNADGDWAVDQWLFKLTPTGELMSALHYKLVETKRGSIKRSLQIEEPFELGKKIWDGLLEGWVKFNP